jgi:hypothetical protein
VVARRATELPARIQICDALSRNVPKLSPGVEILLANCLAHIRRRRYLIKVLGISSQLPNAGSRFLILQYHTNGEYS